MKYGRPIGLKIAVVQSVDSYNATHDSVQDLWVSLPDTVHECSTTTLAPEEGESLQTWADRVTAAEGWAPPPAPTPVPAVLTPMAFYLAFTPAERIAIKTSTDPQVGEFWATFQLALQTGTNVDTGLVSITAGLAYISTHPEGAPLVHPDRVPAILAGTPQ